MLVFLIRGKFLSKEILLRNYVYTLTRKEAEIVDPAAQAYGEMKVMEVVLAQMLTNLVIYPRRLIILKFPQGIDALLAKKVSYLIFRSKFISFLGCIANHMSVP